MSSPKFGIVTPSFNQGHFIEQTINSVLSQNYPNLEYWIIDGGSTDETVNILKKFGKKINWVSEKDDGQTDAINKGFAKIKDADIYAFINSDDLYAKDAFKQVAEMYLKNQADWIIGDYEIIDQNGEKMPKQSLVKEYKRFLLKHYSSFLLRSTNSIVPQPSTFWSAKAMRKVGNLIGMGKYVMEYDYWLKLDRNFKPFYLDNVLSYFRLHGSSASTVQFKKILLQENQISDMSDSSPIEKWIHRIHTNFTLLGYNLIGK